MTPQNDDNCWAPLSIHDISDLFKGADFPWWLAGGLAIDQFVGRTLRKHADIDVLLMRKDHTLARSLLKGWDCWAVDPPGTLRPWPTGETLSPSIHDIWCRRSATTPWQLQLMLDEGDDRDWRSRRCPRVTKPIAELGHTNAEGVPVIAREVQLFYKAKAPRPQDHIDFMAALPVLTPNQRTWLRNAIREAYGSLNPWLTEIDTMTTRSDDPATRDHND